MTDETEFRYDHLQLAAFPVGEVRAALHSDLVFIRDWLTAEEVDGFGFIHNWTLIENACAEHDMTVFAALEGPVAFITRGLSHSTILQTKSSHQRLGIARLLVQHELKREESLRNAVVVVECCPSTSVAFWSAMGFEPHRETAGNSIYMHHLSKLTNEEIAGADLQCLTISTYPQSALYSKLPVSPDQVSKVRVWHDPQYKTLDLAQRVSIANESALGDVVVDLTWNDRTLYRGKAKHDKAFDIGLCPTPNGCGWYLDLIDLSQVSDQ